MFNLKGVRTFYLIILLLIIVFISFTLIILVSNSLKAADNYNFLFDIQEPFLQNKWVESKNEAILYLINFHKIDRDIVDSLLISTYIFEFDDSAVPDLNWSYSCDEELLELLGKFNENSFFTLNAYRTLLNNEKDYTSWLLCSKNRSVEFSLEEKYIGLDQLREAEKNLLLEISITPHKISYDTQEILSDIEFYYGSKKDKNLLKTTVWLGNNSLEDIGVVAKKRKTNRIEQIDYYILQIAAIVIPVDEFFYINESLITIGDLSEINKLFDNRDTNNRPNNKAITLSLSDRKAGIKYRQTGKTVDYLMELNQLSEEKKITYLADARFFLDDFELFALSILVSNELDKGLIDFYTSKSLDPVYRLGVYDKVSWSDNLSIALSYYPLSFNRKYSSDYFWCLNALYQREKWNFKYKRESMEDINLQELSIAYLLAKEKEISIDYGLDYNGDTYLSLAYSFSL